MDFSHFDHQAKEEGLVYGLEKVKRDMFAINKTLGFDAIDTLIISKFIEKIQLYGIEKSLVTPGNMRRIIFWGILGLGSLALTGYIVFDVIPRWDTLWDKWRENLTNTADKAVEKVVETFFDVAEKRAQSDKFKKLIETLSDTAVGSVYKAGSERVSETKNNIVRPFVDNPLVNGIGNIVNGVKEYFSSNTNTDGTPPEDTNREQKKATMPPYKGRD